MPTPPSSVTGVTRWILDHWFQGGWVGVDLFFVLSGFLVAGLLFAELRSTGRMRIARFYGRRGFKIYPAFYFFLALSAIVIFVPAVNTPTAKEWAAEILFLQSYLPGNWGHTWSLAVEEHFYLVLPLLLVALRIGRDASRRDANRIIAIGAAAAVGCLALRLAATIRQPKFDTYVHLFPSHLRFDALMCGVVLAYFWHFRREQVLSLYRWRLPIFGAGVVLLLPPFRFPVETPAMHTIGLTTNYLGGVAILTAVLLWNSRHPAVRALGWLGPYTYSIYLWHEVIPALAPVGFGYAGTFVIYVVGAFLVGWTMGVLVEWPALRLRDRLLPRSVSTAEAPLGESLSR